MTDAGGAPWSVVFAAEARNDLLLISEHLIASCQSFGEPPVERHAAARIDAIISEAERLAMAPMRGESHDDLLPGLRHLARLLGGPIQGS